MTERKDITTRFASRTTYTKLNPDGLEQGQGGELFGVTPITNEEEVESMFGLVCEVAVVAPAGVSARDIAFALRRLADDFAEPLAPWSKADELFTNLTPDV